MEEENINSETHFYLYAKGHYKKTNILEDLRKIQSERCGIKFEHTSDTDALSTLTDLAFKHIMESGNPKYEFDKFLGIIQPNSYFLMLYKRHESRLYKNTRQDSQIVLYLLLGHEILL